MSADPQEKLYILKAALRTKGKWYLMKTCMERSKELWGKSGHIKVNCDNLGGLKNTCRITRYHNNKPNVGRGGKLN